MTKFEKDIAEIRDIGKPKKPLTEEEKLRKENKELREKLAQYEAHSQGMTVQELSRIDDEYSDLEKSDEDEERASKRLEQFSMLPYFYPEGPIEARELVRCYMKYHEHEETVVDKINEIGNAVKALTWIEDALIQAYERRHQYEYKRMNQTSTLKIIK